MKRWISGMGLAIALGAAPVVAAPAQKNSPPACVDVQIGQDRTAYLNCLNEAFQRDVAREHASPKPEVPIDAQSSPTQVGTANETAARQRMGNAFGVSSMPQRPSRVFAPPLPMPAPR
jgi:hypothetical protein